MKKWILIIMLPVLLTGFARIRPEVTKCCHPPDVWGNQYCYTIPRGSYCLGVRQQKLSCEMLLPQETN